MAVSRKNTDGLSVVSTNAWKGILALCVLLHHLTLYTDLLKIPGLTLITGGPLGYWSVALFLFFSGYGLRLSLTKKGDTYIRRFPLNKILPFYIIILLLTALYVVLNLTLADAKEVTWLSVLRSCTFGFTFITNGWYLQVQLLMYILFYLTAGFLRGNTKKTLALIAAVVVYMILCVLFCMEPYWYQCAPAFLLGVLWSLYRERLERFFENKRALKLIVLWSLFVIAFAGSLLLNRVGASTLCVICRIISILFFAAAFAASVMSAGELRFAENRIIKCLGRISLGIYVMQGVFFICLRGRVINLEQDWLYIVCVVAGTILSAFLVTPLFSGIYSIFKNRKC